MRKNPSPNRKVTLAIFALPTLWLGLALSMPVVAAPGTGTRLTLTRGEVHPVASVAELRAALDAANRTKAAATLLLADGTYLLDGPVLDIQGPGLVIRSASGNRDAVIVRGPDEGPQATVGNVFLVSANDVVIADVTLGYCRYHGIQVRGEAPFDVSGLRVHNCRILNCNEQFIKGSSSETDPVGATDGCIEQCLFEFTRGWAYQFYTGGIDIHKGVNWIVRDNLFRDIRVPAGQSGIAEHAVHFWKRCSTRPQNIVVERNWVVNCDRGIGFGLSNLEGGHQGGASVIRNNLVFNDGVGPHTDVGIGLEQATGVHVDNNTVVVQNYWAPIEYRFAGSTNLAFRNNLVSRPIQRRDDAPPATQASNLERVEMAWFRNVATGDLRLTEAATPALAAGQALDGFNDDVDGQPRPRGSGWDLGAYELDARKPPAVADNRSRDRALVGVNYFAGWWRPLPNKWNLNPAVGDWRTNYPGRVPLLGEYNTQDTMDREIVAAADHGIDFFLMLWYYNGPGDSAEREPHSRFLNEGVRCFIRSPEAHRLGFAIEYCNHPPYQVKTDQDWEECLRAWLPAFRHPSYLRVGGKLVFKVHSWHHFWLENGQNATSCHARFVAMRRMVREAGLGEMLIGCGVAANERIEAGHPAIQFFEFTNTYMDLPNRASGNADEPYEVLARFIRESRDQHLRDAVPYLPFLGTGFNALPWRDPRAHFAFPTREQWVLELRRMQADLDRIATLGLPLPGGGRQKAFTIYAWNEFGEGGIVAPTRGEGTMKLEAIRETRATPPR